MSSFKKNEEKKTEKPKRRGVTDQPKIKLTTKGSLQQTREG